MIRKLLSALFVPTIALVTHSGTAGNMPPFAFRMEPLIDERLAQPLEVDGCPMSIVEWKPTPGQAITTSASPQALDYIGRLCRLAIERYPVFAARVYEYNVPPEALGTIHVTASFLPANIFLDGKGYRNLNDFAFRFASVKDNGFIWGYYHFQPRHVFLRNDVLARTTIGTDVACPHELFKRTFLHEMGHVLNHQWGLLDAKLGSGAEADERVADEFVTWLGFDADPGSSADALPDRARCEEP